LQIGVNFRGVKCNFPYYFLLQLKVLIKIMYLKAYIILNHRMSIKQLDT